MKLKTLAIACSALFMMSGSAIAYDGTNCKSAGNCWEAKPGYPDKIKGSKYDPKHSKRELVKQDKAMAAMEDRNAKRAANFKKTGKWEY
jgi:methanol dehydrogenase (cytochrome c) subunit 2